MYVQATSEKFRKKVTAYYAEHEAEYAVTFLRNFSLVACIYTVNRVTIKRYVGNLIRLHEPRKIIVRCLLLVDELATEVPLQ